jgi:hypothetical protein
MGLPLWRDLATILLIIELMIMVLPFFFLFYFALKGVFAINRSVRSFMPQVRGVFLGLQNTTDKAAGVVTAPVIAVYSYTAFGRGIVQGALAVVKGRPG